MHEPVHKATDSIYIYRRTIRGTEMSRKSVVVTQLAKVWEGSKSDAFQLLRTSKMPSSKY